MAKSRPTTRSKQASKKSRPKAKKPRQPAKAPPTARRSTRASTKSTLPTRTKKRRTAKKPRKRARATARAKPPKPRFDAKAVLAMIPDARRGNAHAILGIDPTLAIREALAEPPEWNARSYDRLLALYLACDRFGHEAFNGIIYDFAEHTYFCYDDEGYGLVQVNTDLGMICATEMFGIFDEARAAAYFEAALHVPYPEGVLEELAAFVATSPVPLPQLAALAGATVIPPHS